MVRNDSNCITSLFVPKKAICIEIIHNKKSDTAALFALLSINRQVIRLYIRNLKEQLQSLI